MDLIWPLEVQEALYQPYPIHFLLRIRLYIFYAIIINLAQNKVNFKKNKNFDSDRVIFLDPLNLNQFINHLGTSSVLLDPIYFGSGNSFHESMFYGTPTVSMPTENLKSRIVLGAYKQMQIENPPIVNSIDS